MTARQSVPPARPPVRPSVSPCLGGPRSSQVAAFLTMRLDIPSSHHCCCRTAKLQLLANAAAGTVLKKKYIYKINNGSDERSPGSEAPRLPSKYSACDLNITGLRVSLRRNMSVKKLRKAAGILLRASASRKD